MSKLFLVSLVFILRIERLDIGCGQRITRRLKNRLCLGLAISLAVLLSKNEKLK
jgi:hypothetical protein